MRIFISFLLLTATVFGASAVRLENRNFISAKNNPLLPPPLFVFDKAAEFELKDQYNKLFSVKFPKNKPTVLVFGDREGAGQIESWVRPLVEKYADKIDIHGVAELSAVPGVGKPLVRRIMKSQVKYSVMLDWSGEVSKSYGYEKGKANLFVVDKAGNIVAGVVGAATEAELEKIYREINRVF